MWFKIHTNSKFFCDLNNESADLSLNGTDSSEYKATYLVVFDFRHTCKWQFLMWNFFFLWRWQVSYFGPTPTSCSKLSTTNGMAKPYTSVVLATRLQPMPSQNQGNMPWPSKGKASKTKGKGDVSSVSSESD